MSDSVADGMPHARGVIPTVLRAQPRRASGGLTLASQRYLLMLRFLVVNSVGFALLAAAAVEGMIAPVIAADSTHLCLLIMAIFIVGLGICAQKIWRTCIELNLAKEFNPSVPSRAAHYVAEVKGRDSGSRAIAASALKLKLMSRIGTVRYISSTLVVLGLIGTVTGFIMALSGVDATKAADVSAVGPMVSTMLHGMAIGPYTTLVGGVLNIWLNINVNMLSGATVSLITEIVGLGERHAQP